MSTTTAFRRLAVASALAAGALLLTLAYFPAAPSARAATLAPVAAPALADSVQVDLSGVSGSITAGSRLPNLMTAQFQNKTNNAITSISPVFTIHLDGMPADGVQVIRNLGSALPAESGGDGTVRLSDPSTFELLRNGRRTVSYQLVFSSTAPSGKATVTLEAFTGGTRLGGDSASTTIRGNATPSKTGPANTATGVQPTFAPGSSYAIASPGNGGSAATSAAEGMPISLYLMGALLVGLGAVVLFLLFRRQKPIAQVAHGPTAQYPVVEHDQPRPTSLGYPQGQAPPTVPMRPVTRPTRQMPTVRDPSVQDGEQPGQYPAPHDPWA